jgi:DNA-directed RNA polymerase specialized sigma24 family protein
MQAEIASQPSFTDLVERLHRDDRAAVGLLVERYGDALRRAIERALLVRRLAGSGAGPGRDPAGPEASDIFQTVLLLFLARLRRQADGSGEPLHFEMPAQLVAYLKAIAEHETHWRPSRANPARAAIGPALPPGLEPASDEPTPSQALLARELLERDQAALAEIVRRLSPEERAIWELVRQELSWPEVARRLGDGSSPEAVRKVFARAVRRIADEFKAEGLARDETGPG